MSRPASDRAQLTHDAYDFAADSRGYTWGLAVEYVDDVWVLRGGRLVQPRESNGLALDPKIRFGDQLELEHAHQIGELVGKVRLLAFRNVTNMGAYADALVLSAATGAAPAVADARRRHAKIGIAISGEQALSADTGVFGRACWADGSTETYAFAEIDRSLSGGVLIKGTK